VRRREKKRKEKKKMGPIRNRLFVDLVSSPTLAKKIYRTQAQTRGKRGPQEKKKERGGGKKKEGGEKLV